MPEDFTIEDTAGHRFTIGRLDLLRRAAHTLVEADLSDEELTDLVDRIRAAQQGPAPHEAVQNELRRDTRTAGLLPLTDSRRDLILLAQLLIAIGMLIIALRPAGGGSVDVRQVIIQTIEQGDVEAGPVAKVGRNAPCPCGSGQKFKRCCGQ